MSTHLIVPRVHHMILKIFITNFPGKARRLKQAKDEATEEIERFRAERENGFKDFEHKHVGSREGVASKIDSDTRSRIDEMSRQVTNSKERVIEELLGLVYDIVPELHKNYQVEE